jgi:acyl transferase domain-containing protein/acyl-CoA synthetase (AMP-forming)/AMP-acid ligase II
MRRTDFDSSAAFSTFVELLRAKAVERPERRAFAFLADGELEEAHLSYAQLDCRARAVAARLQTVTSRGDRVLLLYPPGLEYVAAFFGCLYAGVVAVPTYPPRGNGSLARLQTIVADAQATVALTTASMLSGLEAHLAREPALRLLHWIAGDAIPSTSADAWQAPAIAGDTLAMLQYTSGSAGTPKGVMVTHGNLLANQRSIRHAFGHTKETVGLGWLPLYHDMGLIGKVLQTAYLGTACMLMSPVSFLQKPIRWLQAITRYRVSTSGGPNFAYDLCVRTTTPQQRAGLDLSCWRVAFNGAEPVRADTMKRFTEAFAPCGFRPEAFYPCYGLAEATLIVSGGLCSAPPVVKCVRSSLLQQNRVESAPPGEADSQVLVGCGKSLPDHNVVVVHPETLRLCGESEVGEIWVAGPSVAQGYWNQPTTTAQTFRAYLAGAGEGPFLRTGDLGFLLNGELFVTGRRTDLIIVRGRNYYPQDVEQTVQRCHPALGNCLGAAFPVQIDAEERVVVVQEVRREFLRSLNFDEVVGAVRQAVFEEHGLQIEAFLLLKTATIPKTSSGKIQRHACRRHFLDGTLNAVGRWQQDHSRGQAAAANAFLPASGDAGVRSAENIQDWLIGRMAEQLGVARQDINPRHPFACYGLDSVTAVKMAGSLQEWLGRPVEPTVVYDYPTADLLARFLAGQARESGTPATCGLPAKEPVAVIGLGCRFPGADGPEAFWRLLHEGRCAVGAMPSDRRDSGGVVVRRSGQTFPPNQGQGGFLDGIDRFDPQFFGISPREAESMDPQQRLLLEVSWEALEHAGIAPERTAGSRTGVFIGISSSDYSRRLYDLSHRVGAYGGTGCSLSIAANRVSYALDLHGPSWAVDAACSSSLVAVHQACGSLRQGECDMALAGAVNLILSPELTAVFAQAGMLAADGRCKAFDADADGYVRSEGCGIVVLKLLSKALRDGDTVLALIRGSAVNQGGRTNGLTAPHGPSQQAVVRLALNDAGVAAAEISYVEAHGTGTSLGDPIELNSLKQVLIEGRTAGEPCWIGSVKTNIGHMEAAAGIAGLIKVVLSLQHAEIAPHLHLKRLNPAIHLEGTPLAIPTTAQAWPSGERVRLAGVHSFGFGGTNAHVVVEEPPLLPRMSPGTERPKHVWAFSARTPAARLQLAERYRDFLREHPRIALADACFTANSGRSHFSHRAAVVAASAAEAREKLAALAAGRKTPGVVCGSVAGTATPKVAFLVGNVRCQSPGIGRPLDRANSSFHETLAHCEAVLRPLLPQSLWSVLFPDPGGPCLREYPLYGPPARFAIEYALAGLWESWGIKPSAIVTSRLGWNVAASLAGVFGLEEGLKLAAFEGRLAEAHARGGPTGEESAALILGEMEQVLRRIRFLPPKIPLMGADSGEFSETHLATPDWWLRMAQDTGSPETATVRLGALDTDIVLELGPKSDLLDVVGRSQSGEGRRWLAGMAEDRADWDQMLDTLAQLYVCGAPIDWQTFDRPYSRVRVVLPTYPFERQRYWIERPSSPEPTAAPVAAQETPHSLVGRRQQSAGRQAIPLRHRLEVSPAENRHLTLVSYLKQQIGEVLGLSVSRIDVHQPLSHMGLDSMMAIELKSRIKTEMEVDLSMVSFMESADISDLAAVLDEQLSAAPRSWAREIPPVGPTFVTGQLPPATAACWIEGEL